ncbi:MAG TPA: peptide chain release factor N(5)-glutamine methyltransferase [Clostridiaceae bacterium]|nr:peptide chain release factor N(5)-glutamine methyltransferase [Clostridiaceae bacterium]
MVSIFTALKEGTSFLRNRNIDTPRLDAEVIMAHILNCSRLHLITDGERALSDDEYAKFLDHIGKRAHGMPVAYITGYKEFMGLKFSTGKGVLIPRCDTEIVAECAIDICKRIEGPIYVCDVCCGSGAIGISIAKYVERAFVTMIDVSKAAADAARENAALNGVGDRAYVIQGDLLSPVAGRKFDIIVSNPPYIKLADIKFLPVDVKDYEPLLALNGGADGLEFYRRLCSVSLECLKADGNIIFEIGYNQNKDVKDIMEKNGFSDIEIYRDLAGRYRCIKGVK